MTAQLQVSKAMTRLLIQHPFFGSLGLSLNVHQDDDVDTMCTDGTFIKYGAAFVEGLSIDETMGVLAHEVMHVANLHMLRRGDRDPERWNVATDYAINQVLLDAGLSLPEGGLFDEQYKNMTAEKIFDMLPEELSEEQKQAAGMGAVMDTAKGNGQEMSQAEKTQMEADITAKVMTAAAAAKSVGKLPSSIREMVDIMRRTQVDLDTIMARFVGGDQPDDYTYRRPNRRAFEQYDMYTPSIDAVEVGDTVIAIDTSGSVSSNELSYFLGVMNTVIEDKKPRSITVITHDAKVQSVVRYENGEEIANIECHGRGGTRVKPVFDYLHDEQINPDQMIWLTDMDIYDYPEDTPDYPILWVSSWERGKPAPYGETTYIKAA